MAAYTPSIAPSTIIRSKAEDNEPKKQTKQEFRRQKELEEGRKAGTVPAMTDVETGRDINPHIPHYISNSPWYLNATGPTLKHQKPHAERQIEYCGANEFYKRGVTNKVATKFRKGACENCGSMTHKKKDCFERPRKIGARFTNEDIAPDELIPEDLVQTYDAKRDRWAGFDPAEHTKVIEEFQQLEEARKVIKAAELLETNSPAHDSDSADEHQAKKARIGDDEFKVSSHDEDKYAEGADMPGVKVDTDSRTRITVRNLRIREDTAKYLYNLDPDSAYYDPKSRAMREDPFKNVPADKRPKTVAFQGDNFKRYTGEVRDADRSQLFAWEAQNKGLDVHALAEPTKLEELRREFELNKSSIKSTVQASILAKYGGEEHLLGAEDDDKRLVTQAQSDLYVEFNRKGQVVRGSDKPVARSRYAEDQHPNNHSSVFGSFWEQGLWGYKCCRSTLRNSYCTADAQKATV